MKKYYEARLRLPLAILIVALSSLAAFGANYDGEKIELMQPDGTIVIVKGYGDEFYGRFESLDGYTLIRDCDSGQMVYADLSDDTFDFVPTDVVYDHRNPTDPNHPAFVARMLARSRFEDEARGTRNGHGPALRKHLDLNKEAIRQKRQQRRHELGLDTKTQPSEGAGEVTFEALATEAAAPLSGDIIGLTILVDFSDSPAGGITSLDVNDFCNKIGYNTNGNNGSVRDYFYDISGGNLEYTNIVTAYVRVPHTKAYYREGGNGDCTDGYGYTKDLVKDAIRGAIDLGYDFSSLTRESPYNRVKCLNIFYAGGTDGCGWANGLWPHRSSINNWRSPNGTIFHDYQMTNIGTSLTIKTFCHENGHMMCDWRDYYDYGNDGINSKGLGSYCIMSGGNSKNPPPPNAYLRIKSGWLAPTVINDMLWGTELTAPEDPFDLSVVPTCYKYEKPGSTNEFFLIENCQKNGRRANIPDSGLMIWHVDTSSGTSNEYQDMTPSKHYRVSLEQADGMYHLETSGSGYTDDLFHAGNNEAFGHNTLPDSKWWDGSNSGLYISEISSNSVNMTFVIGEGAVDAGINMITWSGEEVQLDPNVGYGYLPTNFAWSADPDAGVVFSNPNVEAPTVTITKVTDNPSVVTLRVVVDDEYEDTMTIDVYDDACKATIGAGLAADNPTDFDENCITGFGDIAEMAKKWLIDNALTEAVPLGI